MRFIKVIEEEHVVSKSGFLKRLKASVLDYILDHYKIPYNIPKPERIKSLIKKLDDDEFRKVLKKLKKDHFQPSKQEKIEKNLEKALKENKIRAEGYEKEELKKEWLEDFLSLQVCHICKSSCFLIDKEECPECNKITCRTEGACWNFGRCSDCF